MTEPTKIRPPAVAGFFYPATAEKITAQIQGFLAEVKETGPAPKAMIAPHAGTIYSGPVAASAYGRLREAKDKITRVVLLGPAHRVPVLGLAAPSADFFETPLGKVPIDHESLAKLKDLEPVRISDAAHAEEHSLEVHLPFLQHILKSFTLVPLVVGEAAPAEVGEVLERLWGGEETLIVISSDLSHYHDYATAQRLDRETCRAIEACNPGGLGYESACGRHPVAGLLHIAAKKKLTVKTLDLRNSGDTAGNKDRVVGYGAWAFG